MADTPGTYYSPSGVAPFMGMVLMLVGGTIGAFIVSWIYGYVTCYNPFIYINFFATIIYGALVGGLTGMMGQFGKVRSSLFGWIFGLGLGCIGVYFAWSCWMYATLNRNDVDLTVLESINPLILVSFIIDYIDIGFTLGSGKTAVTGIPLVILWVIEAGAIIVICAMTTHSSLVDTPFCEECDVWTEEESEVARLEVTETDMLQAALEQQTFEVLTLLPKASTKSKNYLTLDLHVCPQCKESCYLTVKETFMKKDSDGDESEETEERVKNISIPASVVEEVRAIMTGEDTQEPSGEDVAQAPDEETMVDDATEEDDIQES